MNVYASHDTAENGSSVNTTVALLWDDDAPFAERPFKCTTWVCGCSMAHSFHKTATDAKREAAKMHAAYLEVHSA